MGEGTDPQEGFELGFQREVEILCRTSLFRAQMCCLSHPLDGTVMCCNALLRSELHPLNANTAPPFSAPYHVVLYCIAPSYTVGKGNLRFCTMPNCNKNNQLMVSTISIDGNECKRSHDKHSRAPRVGAILLGYPHFWPITKVVCDARIDLVKGG